MTNLLIKIFVKDYKDTQNEKVRLKLGQKHSSNIFALIHKA